MNLKKNNIALVTGASRGIGKAIASGLSGLGYQLVITARNSLGLEELSLSPGACVKEVIITNPKSM